MQTVILLMQDTHYEGLSNFLSSVVYLNSMIKHNNFLKFGRYPNEAKNQCCVMMIASTVSKHKGNDVVRCGLLSHYLFVE